MLTLRLEPQFPLRRERALSFEYSHLPREYPRHFLPSKIDLTDVARLKELFHNLQNRTINSGSDLEKWLKDESELASALAEEQSIRYARMTCQTDDSAREKDYLFFVENIEPEAKIGFSQLDRKYLGTPARKNLPNEQYFVLNRKMENNVALFREENVELEKEETKLAQTFQKITGAMTVLYEGQERTMQQMGRFLEEPDQSIREKTWLLSESRRQKDRDTLNHVYDQLIALRQRIAENAGFDNYRDYIFRKRERFDYTAEDCFHYHEAVEQHIVPLIRELDKERKKGLGVEPLRPWDLAVDPKGRPALRPFKTSSELIQGCVKVFEKINPDFATKLKRMASLNLLDLESRKGKAPGGYNMELAEIRLPFVFMNAVGRDGDVWTLLHESGHAFHVFAVRDKGLPYQYRAENVPLEIAEVASQAMEIIGGEHLEGTFYNKEDAARSKREHLASILKLLAWIATIDAFQHWIYTNSSHTREERQAQWLNLRKRFGGAESWNGYEEFLQSQWQRQLHLFEVPFYYIEYGIAFMGALGLWTRYRKDPKAAISAYQRALALGGSKPLPELFKAAELPFDFGPRTIQPYAKELHDVLAQH
jgi:oligoendopeptidase F